MTYKLYFILVITILLSACNTNKATKTKDVKVNYKVALVSTNYGDFKVKLYDETPLHRDNFIKLCEKNFFDSLLFHRVIKNFMIQGGDPESKNAPLAKMLGNGGPGYTIPAEFDTSFINKKGALCAAREGDAQNPEKRSSGSQFYIVTGKTFSNSEIDKLEAGMEQQRKANFIKDYISRPENTELKNKFTKYQRERKQQELKNLVAEIELLMKPEYDSLPKFKFSEKHREIYKTVGGAPHLDGAYTVFGEIIEGMNVVDSISIVQTGKADRPINDIIFNIKILD